jgi:hypothetical protein
MKQSKNGKVVLFASFEKILLGKAVGEVSVIQWEQTNPTESCISHHHGREVGLKVHGTPWEINVLIQLETSTSDVLVWSIAQCINEAQKRCDSALRRPKRHNGSDSTYDLVLENPSMDLHKHIVKPPKGVQLP